MTHYTYWELSKADKPGIGQVSRMTVYGAHEDIDRKSSHHGSKHDPPRQTLIPKTRPLLKAE